MYLCFRRAGASDGAGLAAAAGEPDPDGAAAAGARPWGGANHTEWTCRGFAVVCQPSEGAAYTLHEPVLASVAPYVGARVPAE